MDTPGLAAIHAAVTTATGTQVEPPANAPKMIGMPEAEFQANLAAANADGRKAGATAERARIRAIVGAPEAKGREALAQSLAFDTDLVPEQALAVMKSAPEAKASRLDGLVPQPKVEATEAPEKAAGAGLAAAVDRRIAKTMPGQKALRN